jgi:hypothetical protein
MTQFKGVYTSQRTHNTDSYATTQFQGMHLDQTTRINDTITARLNYVDADMKSGSKHQEFFVMCLSLGVCVVQIERMIKFRRFVVITAYSTMKRVSKR